MRTQVALIGGRAARFSWCFTSPMHRFAQTGGFGRRMRRAGPGHRVDPVAAPGPLAENCPGLPMNPEHMDSAFA